MISPASPISRRGLPQHSVVPARTLHASIAIASIHAPSYILSRSWNRMRPNIALISMSSSHCRGDLKTMEQIANLYWRAALWITIAEPAFGVRKL
jgi:hypothetical protein